jgi:hypothetical protein
MWPLLDILISTLMFVVFKRETRRVREWRSRQHKAVNSGRFSSNEKGHVVAKLRPLEHQQGPSTGLGVAMGMWPLFFVSIVVLSGAVLPLQPNQIPPDTIEWKIGIWFGFIMICLIPWLFAFAILWPGNSIQVVMEKGILNLRLFRGPTFIEWNEVKRVYVTYNKLGDWFFYVIARHGTMIIGHHDKKIKEFANAIMKNLPQEKWAEAGDYLLEAVQQASPETS